MSAGCCWINTDTCCPIAATHMLQNTFAAIKKHVYSCVIQTLQFQLLNCNTEHYRWTAIVNNSLLQLNDTMECCVLLTCIGKIFVFFRGENENQTYEVSCTWIKRQREEENRAELWCNLLQRTAKQEWRRNLQSGWVATLYVKFIVLYIFTDSVLLCFCGFQSLFWNLQESRGEVDMEASCTTSTSALWGKVSTIRWDR